MDIGKPKRTYIVEPVEDPVPQRRPAEVKKPAEKKPLEPEKTPARVRVPAAQERDKKAGELAV